MSLNVCMQRLDQYTRAESSVRLDCAGMRGMSIAACCSYCAAVLLCNFVPVCVNKQLSGRTLTYDRHHRLVPELSAVRKDRNASPAPGGSTLITSAPKYASAAPQKLPATT